MTASAITASLTVLKVTADTAIAIAACWGTFRWLPRLFDRLRLVTERNEARSETERMREMLMAMGGGTTGLTSTIETLRIEINDMRRDVEDMRRVQIVSTRYIATLIGHISDGGMSGNMPPIPAELRDDVLEHLRTAQEART